MQAASPIEPAAQPCSWANPGAAKKLGPLTSIGSILAALGLCAACCLLPMVLAGVGLAGAWLGMLDALVPYKWLFVVATTALLGYGFYAAYRKSACSAGAACAASRSSRKQRIVLWVATILAIAALAFEQVEPLLHAL